MSAESPRSANTGTSGGSSGSISNTNSTSSPLAMAASARDRFQASARELFKNLEEALSINKEDSATSASASKDNAVAAPWESAIRTMFSSCTSGAESNTLGPEASYACSPTSGTTPTPRSSKVVVTPTRVGGEEGNPVPVHRHNKAVASSAQVPPMPQQLPHKDAHEHIYAQLFFDDQIRAAKAVHALRKQELTSTPQHQQLPHSPPINVMLTPSPVPAPFPSSSHPRRQGLPPPLAATELDISRNLTFDDSISAISAHTLEAMANNMKHMNSDLTKSTESSLFPPEQQQQTTSLQQQQPKSSPVTIVSPPPPTLGATKSPFSTSTTKGFETHHSQQYHHNNNPILPIQTTRSRSNSSRHSKNSHSTRTTESSSFDNWQQEDKKYWVRVAHKDGKHEQHQKQRRGTFRSNGRILPPTGGTTNPRSPHRHPHDTTLELNMMSPHSSSHHHHHFDAFEREEEDPAAFVDNPSRYRVVPVKNGFTSFSEI